MLRYLSPLCDRLLRRSTGCLVLASSITFISVGCAGEPSGTHEKSFTDSSINTGKELTTLNIVLLPTANSVELQNKLKPLSDYLKKTLGRPVNLQIPKDYNTAVDLITADKVDIAYLGPLTYVQARKKNPGIQPIVAPIDKTTGRPWYTSVIVANSHKGIKTLKNLPGKRFGFVSKSSTTGYLAPLAEFKNIGLEPERDFASIEYTGNHDISEIKLISGAVDAVATDKPSYLIRQKSGKLKSKQYQVIWESDPLPHGPIVISSKFPPQLILPLKKALIGASEGLVDVNGAEAAGYTLVQDEDYEPIRKMQKQLETTK